MRRLAVILLAAVLYTPTTMAADGSSGCGPGWYVLKKNSLLSSFFRALTNGILSPVVTLGMTFGTSNCSKHSIVDGSKESEHFAMVTFENLRQDIARGEGPYLSAYEQTFGCPSQGPFAGHLQGHFQELFRQHPSPSVVVQRTQALIKRTPDLANVCKA